VDGSFEKQPVDGPVHSPGLGHVTVRHSDHAGAAFHAASRAIYGGPVYVSGSLGGHDFALLRRLVFSDGTVPRCLHYALPTRDCLFKNPLFDQETVLKIWNLNKVSFF
jgi:stachyose synthetase